MGVGRLDRSSGVDLWLRAVHAVRSTRPDVSIAWLWTPGEHPDTAFGDAIAHERWHLGLDALEIVESDGFDALAARAASTVVMVTARPPVDGAPGDDGSWRTAVGFARTARAKVAGFRSSVVPSVVGGAGGEVELVDYPDVEALAAVAVSAFAVPDRGVRAT